MSCIDLDLAHAYRPDPKVDDDYALLPLKMTFDDGGAYALLGPSGCGKTTLLNIVSGLVKPSQGSVRYDGVDVTARTPQQRNIAQVFQFPVIYDTMTVAENLAFPLRNRGVAAGKIKERVGRIAEMLEMGAAGAQLGTLFAAARESVAHPRFKHALIRARSRDAMPSVQLDDHFPVIPVRGLVNAGTKAFLAFQTEARERVRSGALSREAAQLSIEHFWAGALRRAVVEGDVEHGSVMAGQSVGMVTAELPVADILEDLVAQAAAALALRRHIFDPAY